MNIDDIKYFYDCFHFLYEKVKHGWKLNFFDKCIYDICEEYIYYKDFDKDWRLRSYEDD